MSRCISVRTEYSWMPIRSRRRRAARLACTVCCDAPEFRHAATPVAAPTAARKSRRVSTAQLCGAPASWVRSCERSVLRVPRIDKDQGLASFDHGAQRFIDVGVELHTNVAPQFLEGFFRRHRG